MCRIGVWWKRPSVLGLLYSVYICGREEKLLALKLNNLLKHQGHHKAKVSMHEVNVNSFYYNKGYIHVKLNEQC
jgi:hypothetical protein